jgi:hypothetical protein
MLLGAIVISGFWSIAIERYCSYFNRCAAPAVAYSTDVNSLDSMTSLFRGQEHRQVAMSFQSSRKY